MTLATLSGRWLTGAAFLRALNVCNARVERAVETSNGERSRFSRHLRSVQARCTLPIELVARQELA